MDTRPVYAVSAVLFLIAIHVFAASSPIPKFGEWLSEWQDLVAGLLALVGAYWALMGIRQQIEQSELHHKAELRRRNNAARVALPLALAEVSGFVQKIADIVTTELEAYCPVSEAEPREILMRQGLEMAPLPDVELPQGVIEAFQAFVETLDEEKEVRHVAELLSSIQILKARYDSLDFSHAAMEFTLYERLLDAAKVGYLNDCLYNFGRYLDSQSFAVVREIGNADAWEKIRARALSLIHRRAVPDIFFDGINSRIDRRKERDETPWLEKFEVD